MENKIFQSLSKKTQNALERNRGKDSFRDFPSGIGQDRVYNPHTLTVSELLQIKGIGPAAVKEIAEATERFCL